MSKILHETDYCKLLAEGAIQEGENISAVQRIWVKELKREEVRFAWYKEKQGRRQFVPRPLDVTEDKLIEILECGIQQGVFTEQFREKLKNVL